VKDSLLPFTELNSAFALTAAHRVFWVIEIVTLQDIAHLRPPPAAGHGA